MEQRRLDIRRRTSDLTREYIAEIIKKSVVNLRGEYPEQIKEIVNNLSFNHSHIPEFTYNEGALFREQGLNNLLELIYIDLLIQYGDLFSIQDILKEMKAGFESAISANVVKASELSSKARDFKAFSSSQFDFTDVHHESFLSTKNYTQSDYACQINNGAGVVKMPGVVEQYALPETSDVFITPVSEAVKLVDENESAQAYLDDMTEPYFVTLFSTGNPHNSDVPSVELSAYNGMVVDITIRFNTVVPVTRVQFKPFSNAPMDIIGVFYSLVPEGSWSLGDVRVARRWSLDYSTDDTEINFPRVYAREIHILAHQSKFNLVRSDIEIEDVLSAKDYIEAIAENMVDLMPHGFIEHDNLSMQIQEIIDHVNSQATIKTEKPVPNTRSYVMGLCDLQVSNVSYMHFGDFLSKGRQVNGNVHAVSFLQDGDIVRDDGGIVDSCALFSIEAAGESIYVGYHADDGRVIDGAVINANLEFNKGAMIKNSTHPYKFETHFRPTATLSGFEIYNNGEMYTLPSGVQIEEGTFTTTIKLPKSFCETYNLLEGVIITMLYDVDTYDELGRPYSTSQVRIADRIGRPNIAINEAAYIKDSYLYVLTESGSIGYAPQLNETTPSEWEKVTISGDTFFYLTSDKGLPMDGIDILENDGNYYVKESKASGPFDDFYYGSLKEEPEFLYLSGLYNVMQTEVPYIKGTLKAFYDDKLISNTSEYDVDTVGNILSDSEKQKFLIPSSYSVDEVKICYMPIDPNDTTDNIASNIAQYNGSEQFRGTTERKVTLSKYPYLDPDIISSQAFDFKDGIFSLKWKYSVTYEPIVVFVNGIKAVNITEYREGIQSKPPFRKSYREDDYQFYVEAGKNLVFNQDITGNIVVYFYELGDRVRERIEMYRSNYSRDDVTPEVYSYTLLANIQR